MVVASVIQRRVQKRLACLYPGRGKVVVSFLFSFALPDYCWCCGCQVGYEGPEAGVLSKQQCEFSLRTLAVEGVSAGLNPAPEVGYVRHHSKTTPREQWRSFVMSAKRQSGVVREPVHRAPSPVQGRL